MAWNDLEWLGMDKNLSLIFFTRNEVGIWSDSYLFGRIRSECVGKGKVLVIAVAKCTTPTVIAAI